MCERMPLSSRSIAGVPSCRGLPGFPITAHHRVCSWCNWRASCGATKHTVLFAWRHNKEQQWVFSQCLGNVFREHRGTGAVPICSCSYSLFLLGSFPPTAFFLVTVTPKQKKPKKKTRQSKRFLSLVIPRARRFRSEDGGRWYAVCASWPSGSRGVVGVSIGRGEVKIISLKLAF